MKTEAKTDIQDIWTDFYRTRDEGYRNLLIEHYKGRVRYCAKRLHGKMAGKVELDDLVSAGNFGLMDAIDGYDPDRGVKFETYCSHRINGSILDELRRVDWLPRVVRLRASQFGQTAQSFSVNLGRKPSEDEVAAELGIGIREVHRLCRDAKVPKWVSLNSQSSDYDRNKETHEIDVIRNPKSEEPLTEAEKGGLKDLLAEYLSRTEKLVLVLYYYEEMTMKEIGATLDMVESRVSQIHSSAINRLKAKIARR